MSSSPCVHEVLVIHDQASIEPARWLQRVFQRDGLRAGLVAKSGSEPVGAARQLWHCHVDDGWLIATGPVNAAARSDSFILPLAAVYSAEAWSSFHRLTATASLLSDASLSAAGLRERTRRSYDALATQFTDVWFDEVPGESLDSFLRYLPRGATVLDAGCGPGHHARYFRRAGVDPVGLDFSRGMIDIARAKVAGVPFVLGDLAHHPLPAERFDGVWSAVAFNHIPAEETQAVLSRLVGTLKPGGVIGINLQIGRRSELVCREQDRRFFEYPPDAQAVVDALASVGVRTLTQQLALVTRNTHGLPISMRFATVVGRREGEVRGRMAVLPGTPDRAPDASAVGERLVHPPASPPTTTAD